MNTSSNSSTWTVTTYIDHHEVECVTNKETAWCTTSEIAWCTTSGIQRFPKESSVDFFSLGSTQQTVENIFGFGLLAHKNHKTNVPIESDNCSKSVASKGSVQLASKSLPGSVSLPQSNSTCKLSFTRGDKHEIHYLEQPQKRTLLKPPANHILEATEKKGSGTKGKPLQKQPRSS